MQGAIPHTDRILAGIQKQSKWRNEDGQTSFLLPIVGNIRDGPLRGVERKWTEPYFSHPLSVLCAYLLASSSQDRESREVRKRGKANCSNTHRDNSSLMGLLAIYPYQVPATSRGICHERFSPPALPSLFIEVKAHAFVRVSVPSCFVFPGILEIVSIQPGETSPPRSRYRLPVIKKLEPNLLLL